MSETPSSAASPSAPPALRTAIAVLLLIAAIGGFLYYRWQTSGAVFDWNHFAQNLTRLDPFWASAAVLLILLAYPLRAVRWAVFMRPYRSNPSLWGLTTATAIGFTAIVLFGRPGELVRPYLIARRENVTVSSQIAAWVLERILDLLMVLGLFGIALSQVSPSQLPAGSKAIATLRAGGYLVTALSTLCFGLLIAMRLFSTETQRRLMEVLTFLPQPIHARIEKLLASFREGVESTKTITYLMLLLLYTVFEWVAVAGAYVCLFRAFAETRHFSVGDAIIVLGFVAFGSVLQLPGVGGGMQVAVVVVLTELFGVAIEPATGIAIVLWLISFVTIVPVGLALAFAEGVSWRRMRSINPETLDTKGEVA